MLVEVAPRKIHDGIAKVTFFPRKLCVTVSCKSVTYETIHLLKLCVLFGAGKAWLGYSLVLSEHRAGQCTSLVLTSCDFKLELRGLPAGTAEVHICTGTEKFRLSSRSCGSACHVLSQ